MKKVLGLLLVLSLLAGLLIACGNESAANENSTPTEGLEDSVFDDNTSGQAQRPTTQEPGNSDQIHVEPTQSQQGQDSTTPTQGQESTPTNPTSPTGPIDSEVVSLDYKTFLSLSPAQKKEYQESFSDLDAFFVWYNAARDAYIEANPTYKTDGSVNMDEISGTRK